MSRFLILMVLSALLLAASGCASLQAQKQSPFAGLPFRHNGFDFKKAWKATPSPEGLAVDIVLKNVRYPRVEDVQVIVFLLRNGNGKAIAEGSAFSLGSIDDNQYSKLRVILKNATASPGDQLRFSIRYRGVESSNSTNWRSDFTADAFSGATLRNEEETTLAE